MLDVLDLVQSIEAAGIPIAHLDFGGGLGITYRDEEPPAADALWAALLAKLDARGYGDRTIMIEPGRSLVGNAGVCLTEVLYLKPGEQKSFCIVDAAMVRSAPPRDVRGLPWHRPAARAQRTTQHLLRRGRPHLRR